MAWTLDFGSYDRGKQLWFMAQGHFWFVVHDSSNKYINDTTAKIAYQPTCLHDFPLRPDGYRVSCAFKPT
jgi:hypothetical protein